MSTTTDLVEPGKIIVSLRQRTASVRLTRLDGDQLPIPHTEVTITWSPDVPADVRIPGRGELLGPVATAARLELPFEQAHRVQEATERLLADAWSQFGAPAVTRHGDAWLAIRDADGQMIGTNAHTLATDLREWCTPTQRADLLELQSATISRRPTMALQRRLGILLVAVHPHGEDHRTGRPSHRLDDVPAARLA